MSLPEERSDMGQPSPRDTVVEASLMLMAVLPMLVSFQLSLTTGEGHWFQRSGALMVLFSVGIEYHRRHVMRCLPGAMAVTQSSLRMAHWIHRFWRSIPYVCYTAIAVGTLVWSYGDLLFA
ncbi:hypothetical protein [Billgrantia antri]|uniref:Uncharacterized protein n=1 Tax=Billgrantia antri TaxID=2846777 RepID=A0ABS6ZIE1_9GAMM|nr:hypothetical protein [Halomonas antri]MBW6389832.1 hypothetical protein [Halomonas antri]